MEDAWKHRSAGMRCHTCLWWVPKVRVDAPKEPQHAPSPRAGIGRCRRHAPTMNGYPVVYESDWCGDHKLDEEKV